jgi:lipoprotein-anchoring transpeptidase ErfK/SrfK
MRSPLSTLALVLVVSTLIMTTLFEAPIDAAGTYTVRRGDTMLTVAARHGVRVSELARANGLRWNAWVYAGQRLRIPGGSPSTPSSGGIHIVGRGETLSSIARRYGTTVNAFVQANGLGNRNFVWAGQRLSIPGGSSTPAGSTNTGGTSGRWIDINLSRQRLVAWQGNTPIQAMTVSTGTSRYPTPVGKFRTYAKYPSTNMSGPGYYLPGVPHTMFFYRDYAIHGTYWHSNFGTPMSHGCINLSKADAAWLYSWAPVGTSVMVHY